MSRAAFFAAVIGPLLGAMSALILLAPILGGTP